MKTVTKKQIQTELRKLDPTAVFRIAKLAGVNVENRVELMRFVEDNAPTKKVYNSAYRLTLCADQANQIKTVHNRIEQPIMDAADFMRRQISDGSMNTNYGKVLIEGNNNIYWAHTSHGHSDYNKSVAFKNTKQNRKVMDLINLMLKKSVVAKAA